MSGTFRVHYPYTSSPFRHGGRGYGTNDASHFDSIYFTCCMLIRYLAWPHYRACTPKDPQSHASLSESLCNYLSFLTTCCVPASFLVFFPLLLKVLSAEKHHWIMDQLPRVLRMRESPSLTRWSTSTPTASKIAMTEAPNLEKRQQGQTNCDGVGTCKILLAAFPEYSHIMITILLIVQ